jgi:hypothetical protein
MNSRPPVAAESLPTRDSAATAIPDDASGLKAGILRLTQEQLSCAGRLRAFFDAEDPAQGLFYAKEIYALQQEKLCLATELEFYRRKLARLEMEESLV